MKAVPRALRPTVVSFRISDVQRQSLKQIFDRDGATGVRSTAQYARKILSDFLAGRLHYKNPKDRLVDLDTYNLST